MMKYHTRSRSQPIRIHSAEFIIVIDIYSITDENIVLEALPIRIKRSTQTLRNLSPKTAEPTNCNPEVTQLHQDTTQDCVCEHGINSHDISSRGGPSPTLCPPKSHCNNPSMLHFSMMRRVRSLLTSMGGCRCEVNVGIEMVICDQGNECLCFTVV